MGNEDCKVLGCCQNPDAFWVIPSLYGRARGGRNSAFSGFGDPGCEKLSRQSASTKDDKLNWSLRKLACWGFRQMANPLRTPSNMKQLRKLIITVELAGRWSCMRKTSRTLLNVWVPCMHACARANEYVRVLMVDECLLTLSQSP